MATSFQINAADLAFILRQIKISEAHSGGISLTQAIMNEYGVSATDANLVPFGLRTVDGSLNNLAPGQEFFGASGQLFPRMLDPAYLNDTDGDAIDFNGPFVPGGVVIQGNYGLPGNVIDADPRTISNLVVDQSLNNPAAILAALGVAGVVGADAMAALFAIQAAFAAVKAAHAAALGASPAAIAALQAIFDAEVLQQAQALADYNAALAADVYLVPSGLAAAALAAAEAVKAAMNTIGSAIFGPNVDQIDIDYANAAVATATSAVNAAATLVAALAGLTGEAAAITLHTETVSMRNALTSYATGLALGEPVGAPDELQQVLDLTATAVFNGGLATVLSTSLTALVDPLGLISGALAALNTANAELAAAGGNLAAAQGAGADVAAAQAALTLIAGGYGVVVGLDGGVEIANLSPDIGLSPSFNSWMTFFGQFFDHGLDLVSKGGNGKVFIPLKADDPLRTHGPDGIAGSGDEVPPHLAFMVVTRAAVDANGNSINLTTPFIDQNQTYTSHASHQVFLREFVRVDLGDGNGTNTLATGALLDGTLAGGSMNGSIANWADVKAQALTMLGIILTDYDVGRVPLLATDAYGELILGPNGYAQLVMEPLVPGGLPWLKEGTLSGVTTAGSTAAGRAFLDDIAHHAAPAAHLVADTDPGVVDDFNPATYDDEMLNSHMITGDGRGNENIALATVHTVFHAEHNRTVEVNKDTLIETTLGGDFTFLNEWLLVDVIAIPVDLSTLVWDGERMFQAARFTTEMQYQHLVFEEFARRIQPAVDPFVFTHSPDVNAAIVAEFAHTVYRFGHSMLTDTVQRLENDLTTVNGEVDQATLIEAFLNPQMFLASGANIREVIGNIVRGTTLDVGNAIDEFVVPSLQSNLLGLPLDLPAINIARGRDTGIPSLNEARKQFYADYGLADLKPYTSWLDFAQHIKNPASIINFIAAYGTHATVEGEATLVGKRAAAMALVTGVEQTVTINSVVTVFAVPLDRADFLNATGAFATVALGGMNNVDFWIGGLAEELNEFGGMLGSTFNLVFEFQMEQLQAGDRFYYLSRTQGTNMLNQLEPNTFTDIVMRNSSLGDVYATHLNGSLFVTPDLIFELDRGIAQADYNGALAGNDPIHADPFLQLIDPRVVRDYTGATQILDGAVMHDVGGYLKYSGGEHVVLGGTEGNDTLIGDKGIDALWGDGGNDRLNAGMESDQVFGGDGDDIIEDPFGDDMLRGERGHDVITAGTGLDLIFGGDGNDFISLGMDDKEAFGDEGDDFILGGTGNEFMLGGEGNDWIEGGHGFDVIAGENTELFFNSPIIGHDVAWGQQNDTDYDLESGDDIAISGPGIQRFEGMFGFDWAAAKNDAAGARFDFAIPVFTTVVADILKDRFDQVEAASGWNHDDVISGDDRGHINGIPSAPDAIPTDAFVDHVLTQEGIDRIAGLNDWMGGFDGTDARQTLFGGPAPIIPGATDLSTWRDGNILIGGDGNDIISGRGGYDLIDGDAWLNVRIKIVHDGITYSAESLTNDTTVAGEFAGRVFNTDAGGNPIFTSPAFGGASLNSLLLNGTINPGTMSIVREIKFDETPNNNVDTAVFQGAFAEYEIEGSTDLNGDGDFNDVGEFTNAVDVNGDGFISVRDRDTGLEGAIVDGVQLRSRGAFTDNMDLLKNIEQLQFADGTITIGASGNLVPTLDLNSGTPGTGNTAEFIENGAAVAIAVNPVVVDNGASLMSATIVLTNAQAGDVLLIEGALPAGITLTPGPVAAGTITLNLVGPASLAAFQTAIAALRFSSPSDNPNPGGVGSPRLINVTVNDGVSVSLIAVATVNVTAVDDLFVAGADRIVTNIGNGPAIIVPEWALLANDTDPDGPGPAEIADVTGINTVDSLTASLVPVGSVTITDTGGVDGGSLTYTATYGLQSGIGNVALVRDAAGVIGGNDGVNDILVGDGANSAFDGGTGNDSVFAGAGDDTTVWNADDGRDFVDGGTHSNVATTGAIVISPTAVGAGGGATGPRLNFNGATVGGETISRLVDLTGSAEATLSFTWRVDDTEAADDTLVQAFDGAAWVTIATLDGGPAEDTDFNFSLALAPQYIGVHSGIRFVSSNLGGNENVYIDNVQIATPSGTFRDEFTTPAYNNSHGTLPWTTSWTETGDLLAGDTYTVNGSDEAETFRVYSAAAALSAGLTGLRAEAEIIVTRNLTGAAVTNADIIAELDNIEEIVINTAGGIDTVTVVGDFAPTSLAFNTIRVNGDLGDTVDISGLLSGHHVLLNAGTGAVDMSNPGAGAVTDSHHLLMGTVLADMLSGTDDSETMLGLAGRDTMSGDEGMDVMLGGGGADLMYGGDGDDYIFGGANKDTMTGGAGNDKVFGGRGSDTFVAEAGDGDDSYFANPAWLGARTDTLDMSAITANISANLGSGALGRGSVYSEATGSDTIWNMANITTGSGSDTIIAGKAVNIIDGGAGNDIFRFETATAAHGDTIATFQPGDRIDLSGMDADDAMSGHQMFTIVSGSLTGAGQLMVTQEMQGTEMFTVISGSVTGNAAPDFQINIKGAHTLTATDFNL